MRTLHVILIILLVFAVALLSTYFYNPRLAPGTVPPTPDCSADNAVVNVNAANRLCDSEKICKCKPIATKPPIYFPATISSGGAISCANPACSPSVPELVSVSDEIAVSGESKGACSVLKHLLNKEDLPTTTLLPICIGKNIPKGKVCEDANSMVYTSNTLRNNPNCCELKKRRTCVINNDITGGGSAVNSIASLE